MSGLSGRILVTGGSGTLGHAIVRTAERAGWDAQITIYSRSELRQAQMRAKHPACRYVLGDVRDYERLSAAIAGHDLVIHAAAVKRIPEAEQQPVNCYETNVVGTAHVARACAQHDVATAVFISTDKACRSCTTYGASKLLGEGIWRSYAEHGHFVAVRYGNVVASNGSVIPLWRAQAARGAPLPITDRRATRFWMAPSAAVALIVRAVQTVPSGAILVPKMGALSLIEMAGIVAPAADTIEVGLRSLEKIHEDLVHIDERADDRGLDFCIGGAARGAGLSYTSDAAPRLSRERFLSMLDEAETYE